MLCPTVRHNSEVTRRSVVSFSTDGVVVGCDVSEDYTATARKFWAEAGVEHKVKLHIAPATETLQRLLDAREAATFDFAFIDADKTNYDNYYELCLQLMRKGGIIAFDNSLLSAKVLPSEEEPTPNVAAMRALNVKLAADSRVTTVLMNVGDGYTLVTKH